MKKHFSLSLLIITFFALLALGFWQLNRADEKKLILKNYHQRMKAKPITINDVDSLGQGLRFHSIQLQGRYDNSHQFLLDNRFYQHQIGYQVITPFIISNNKIVLINRGWIPRGPSRKNLPQIKPIKGLQKLIGIIDLHHKKDFVLQADQLTRGNWPKVIQRIDYQKMAKVLALKIYPFTVRLKSEHAHAFKVNWQPSVMPPERHIAYAVQWFLLAGVILIAFIISIRPVTKEKQSAKTNEKK